MVTIRQSEALKAYADKVGKNVKDLTYKQRDKALAEAYAAVDTRHIKVIWD